MGNDRVTLREALGPAFIVQRHERSPRQLVHFSEGLRVRSIGDRLTGEPRQLKKPALIWGIERLKKPFLCLEVVLAS